MKARILNDPSLLILALACAVAVFFIFNTRQESAQAQNKLKAKITGMQELLDDLSSPKVGDALPTINTTDLQGKVGKLDYSHAPKKALFIFSSNCKSCDSQKDSVYNKVYTFLKSNGYAVTGISLSPLEGTKLFLQKHSYDFQVLLPEMQSFGRAFRIKIVPQIILSDESGKISLIHNGMLDESEMNNFISSVNGLKQKR